MRVNLSEPGLAEGAAPAGAAPTPGHEAAPLVVTSGDAHPLGARFDGGGTNFALFSAHATKVELCLFDPTGEHEIDRVELPEHTDQVFHGHIVGVGPGALYGYRVHGPYAPQQGHRFNPNKLLLDPYSRAHFGQLRWDAAIFGYQMESGDDLTFDERDSAPFVPKSVIVEDFALAPSNARFAGVPWRDTMVYEAHVKGLTRRHPAVEERFRGTYRGLAEKAVLEHIVGLGVTSVEFLPIHAFVDDGHLLDRSLSNYWGYSTIGFFAPERRYAADPGAAPEEVGAMVAALHDAGLEVILDVVYNHTAEGNELGPTLSFKGIDNASYYRLVEDQPRYYVNDTGTGNTLNLVHTRVVQLVTDSLRYWAQAMDVDGFRFDLGTVLGREVAGFDSRGGFLKAVGQDPVLRSRKLISESWDVGPGGYQVGAFPPGWAEWNDTFRDTVRDFWRGTGHPSKLAPRLVGSGDLFNHDGRRPWASVNFITAHDGFTLHDLVSFNDKHNDANGEGNADGHSDNRSSNNGAEGTTDDAVVLTLRDRQMRNFLATLIFSHGTPMLLSGDEIARTQGGNNNAYCQDNETSWVDWGTSERQSKLTDFLRCATAIRRKYASLRAPRFVTGARNDDIGVKDVAWQAPAGAELTPDDWSNPDLRAFAMLLDERARAPIETARSPSPAVLVLFNSGEGEAVFALPQSPGGIGWRVLLETEERETRSDWGFGEAFALGGRSLTALALRLEDAGPA